MLLSITFFMKKILLYILIPALLIMLAFSITPQGKKLKALHLPKHEAVFVKPSIPSSKHIQIAAHAKDFISKERYHDGYFFLLDLDIPSGKKRFFIYDLKNDSIINAGLVTHGNCNEYWLEEVKYDNRVGCGCSSLGKYKIGYAYYGKFGLAFKLHGLDPTNSNAFKRYVVLHSHECVPDHEVKEEICQSNGCPTVSPAFLIELQALIKGAKDPILLWIID